MMREIKFRAWDLNEDEYLSWDRLINTRYNQDYYRDHGEGQQSLSVLTDKSIILEQFTGLHDSQGKEIYEGDIIEYRGWGKHEIIYEEYGISPFYETDNDGDPWRPGPEECTVIGTIHENPELLSDGRTNGN